MAYSSDFTFLSFLALALSGFLVILPLSHSLFVAFVVVTHQNDRTVICFHNITEQISTLLDCTSWSGAGPGQMDAATKGAHYFSTNKSKMIHFPFSATILSDILLNYVNIDLIHFQTTNRNFFKEKPSEIVFV